MEKQKPTLEEVKELIWQLGNDDRAMLRPFIIGRFDVRGLPVRPKGEE